MERTIGKTKEAVEELGEEAREKYSEVRESARTDLQNAWRDAVSALRRSPGLTLGLSAAGGVAAGILLSRAFGFGSMSPAERKLRNWFTNAEDTWFQLKDGFEGGLSLLRKTADRFR
jgi:hypothetical protein